MQTFEAARELLAPNGMFAFDLYQPNVGYISIPANNRLARAVVDEQGRPLELREDAEYDPASHILTVDWRVVAPDQPDPPLADTQYRMRQYFPEELDRILSAASLVIRDRFGELDRSPFRSDSKRQVLVCEAG